VGAGTGCGLLVLGLLVEEEDCCARNAVVREKIDRNVKIAIRRPTLICGEFVCKFIVLDVLVASIHVAMRF
jgi:hypothetical protein